MDKPGGHYAKGNKLVTKHKSCMIPLMGGIERGQNHGDRKKNDDGGQGLGGRGNGELLLLIGIEVQFCEMIVVTLHNSTNTNALSTTDPKVIMTVNFMCVLPKQKHWGKNKQYDIHLDGEGK